MSPDPDMENEELALHYQQGRTEVIGALWSGVERFVRQRARQFAEKVPPERGVTLGDLEQTGFIAVVEAARTYSPNAGANFLTWLSYHLRKEFMEAAGYHAQHPDPLNDRNTLRLDAPLDEDDAEGDTVGDATPDKRVDVDAAVVDRIYQEQLRAALDDAMNDLPPMEREVMERKYYREEGREEIAASLGLPDAATVTRREQSGLERLSRGAHRRELEAFLYDKTDPYRGVSYAAFARSGASSVENTVFRRERLRREQERKMA